MNNSDVLAPIQNNEPSVESNQRTKRVRIQSGSEWLAVNPSEIWRFRDLLYVLVWRDLKVRYRQTLLGVAWVIVQPVLTMAVFAFFFGRVIGVASDGLPYALFALSGLVPWTFFGTSVLRGGVSLVGSAHLITKIYFPRVIVTIASVLAGLVDFGIAFGVLMIVMMFYGIQPTSKLLFIPVFVALTALLAFSIGLLAATLNVRYRDVAQVLPFLVQLGFYATPVIYPSSLIPANGRWLIQLNPMTGIIDGFRASLFDGSVSWSALGISTIVTAFVLVIALIVFVRMERHFADIV